MKLLQLPTQALEERIKEELEENPALEEGAERETAEDDLYQDNSEPESTSDSLDDFDPDPYLSDDEIPEYRLQANNYSPDDEEKSVPITGGITFLDTLRDQLALRKLSDEDFLIADYLLGNVDEDGYLRRALDDILDDLAFSQGIMTSKEKLEELLGVIQDFEPAGVGARDLKECLLLQLKKRHRGPEVEHAEIMLRDYYEEFIKKHYQKLIEKTGWSEEELKEAIDEIQKLNPKPGSSEGSASKAGQAVTPDFLVTIVDGELELRLNGRNAPELNISREYKNMLQHYKDSSGKATKSEKDALLFVKRKIDAAKWFIDAIVQRQNTLMLTMSAILDKQKAYFLSGDERDLKPMILKDIADEIGMDISTVSRVASNKFVQTPYGTHLVKTFFSEAMTNSDGEEVSTREIKKILEESIEEESKKKPLTDEALAKLLKEKGYPIARRTVAKYREQLGIPVARLRKEL
ncbi:MAG: RNA polymerase factor sigma-54 [Schleiferiaceae bacterium]